MNYYLFNSNDKSVNFKFDGGNIEVIIDDSKEIVIEGQRVKVNIRASSEFNDLELENKLKEFLNYLEKRRQWKQISQPVKCAKK